MSMFVGVMVGLAVMYAAGFLVGTLLEREVQKRKQPHVWLSGNDRCTHCGKTMEECGIKSIDASQYLLMTPPDAKEPR
jgi:hypothetical protein